MQSDLLAIVNASVRPSVCMYVVLTALHDQLANVDRHGAVSVTLK